MNLYQFRQLIVRLLKEIDMYSQEAVVLLLGTAAQESGLTYIRQIKGPALGFFQMEPDTEKDIWDNYLIYRPRFSELIKEITGHSEAGAWLEWDIAYQIIMCRLHYRRIKEVIPPAYNIEEMAIYYKKYYNTDKGKATPKDFIYNYHRLINA